MLTSVLGVKDKVVVAEVPARVASVRGVQGCPVPDLVIHTPVAKAKPSGGVCGTSVKTCLR